MNDRLGMMLLQLREKMGVSQADVSKGLLSVPVLCRVERGEKEIDYIVLKSLFERLGKSLDKLEIVIVYKDYEQIKLRDAIECNLTPKRKTYAEKYLLEYIACVDHSMPIHQQYIKKMQTLIQYLEDDNIENCLKGLKQALEITLPDWKSITKKMGLCNQECRLALLLLYLKLKKGNVKDTERELLIGYQYLQWHYRDSEEQVKIYPHLTWMLGEVYLKQGKFKEAYQISLEGKRCLIENGSFLPLLKLLQLEKECLKIWKMEEELKQCEKYIEAIGFVYGLVGMEYPNDLQVLLKSSSQEEFIIANELLRDLRNANGIAQEKLCEDICNQETLSRIENGKKNPNKTNIYRMFQKMGMNRETYYGFVATTDYDLYEKARLYGRCIPKEKRGAAYELLDELEERLDMSEEINQQFIKTARIGEKVYKKEITKEQAIQELEKLLQLTMPSIAQKEIVYRVPFRQEYSILNHMAVYYRRSGKIDSAIQLYSLIKNSYEKSIVDMKYHVIPGLTLYVNYAGYLEEQNMLIEAKQMGIEGIKFALECGRGDILGELLGNLSLVYLKEEDYESEEKFLRFGLWLAELFQENDTVNILKEAYKVKGEKNGY